MSIAMSRSTILRSILLAPPTLRSTLLQSRTFQATSLQYSTSVPSVTSASFWKSLIPKPFRKEARAAPGQKIKSKLKEWNPATFFINIFLLIGSMSIQMIALRNEYATFSRRADARIGLLKEIIERVQNGEKVDVEGLLGAGDKDKEKEWEEVLQEIEREDEAWEQSRRKKPKHGRNLENNTVKAPAAAEVSKTEVLKTAPKTNAPPGFY